MTVLERVRQSFAATYDSCPHAAFLGEGQPEFSTHPQARGTIAHEFKSRVIRECIENHERTYPTEMAKPLMVEVIEQSGLPVDAQEFDTLMALAWKFVDGHEFDWEHIVDTEEDYTSEIAGVVLTGKPDLVEIHARRAIIKDYKTGWSIDPETEMRGSFQGRWYAKIVLDTYPQLTEVKLVWEYERWSKTREAIIKRSDLPDIDAMLTNLVRRIQRSAETGEWPASPGKWCSLCPAAHLCPIPKDYRGAGLVADRESAQAVAEMLLVLEAVQKTGKSSLRAWCAEHGPVEVGGMCFDFTPGSDSYRVIDKDVLKSAMAGAGLKYEDFFKLVKGSTVFKARKT